ncbi:MAG: hypothetical protein JNL79_40500 [Myxococcales bacterium]|nr:hypothetical protein [Myxococcales bacterium]
MIESIRARHADAVRSACAVEDGFVTASDDGTLKVWRPDGTFVRSLREHEHHVSVARAVRGRRLLSAGYDRKVLLWDLASAEVVTRLSGCKEWIVDAAVSADGGRAATIERLGAVRVWDLTTGRLLARFTHRGSWGALALSPVGDRLYVGAGADDRGRYRLAAYDVASRRAVAERETPWVTDLAVEVDTGRVLAVGGRTLHVYDAALEPKGQRAHDAALIAVVADEDGPVTADAQGLVVTWDHDGGPNGGYRREISAPVTAFAWSGLGGSFLLGLEDGEVVVRPPSR